MNRYLRLSISSLLIATCTYAQTPDDALRSAWFIPGGSARNMATGGVMGSLGGDITANNVNPAGIGLYKTREFVISPGFFFNSNKTNFRDSSSSRSKNAFAYGPIGFVFGRPHDRDSKWTSSAFSISVSQLASYNNHMSYAGYNNMTSFSEQYLEELTKDGADENAANGNYINGASLAFRTFLIDTLLDASHRLIGYKSNVPIRSGLYQQYDENTSGGYHEIALAFAGNMADKLYLGGGINIPVVSYRRDLYYRESVASTSGLTKADVSSFEYRENFKSSGVGFNAKLGLIYKPKEFIRLGLAFHTPSVIFFKDELRSSINTTFFNSETRSESSDNLNSGNAVTRDYYQVTPWRAIVSGSYVFREVENTHKQRAFLSADIEYVNYRGSRYFTSDNNGQAAKDYYKSANDATKSYLKSAFNFRLGGELKFDPWMFRLGLAYYGSPYSDKALKANRMMASGGIGYRNHGMFIDLTYAYTMNKDVNFPYRLNDLPNTFATTKNNRGNVVLTLGFKI